MKKIILALGIVNCLAIIIAVIILSIPQKTLPSTEPNENIVNTNKDISANKQIKIFDAYSESFHKTNETKFLIWINIPEFKLRFYNRGKLVDSGKIAAGKHFSPTIDVLAYEITYRPSFYPTDNEIIKGWKPAPPDATNPPEKPRNPLGRRRIVLHQNFRLHGTNNEKSLGKPASNGCTRVENSPIERITDTITNNSAVSKHYGRKNFTETYILAEPFRVIQCYRLWNNIYLNDTALHLTIFRDIHRRLDREIFEPSFPWSKDIPGNAYLKEHLLEDLAQLGIYIDLTDNKKNWYFSLLWERLKEKIKNTKESAVNIYIELPNEFRELFSSK